MDGNVDPKFIFIFVANTEELEIYKKHIPKEMYNNIVVGKKGIANQRKFISRYFPAGQYVISIDDDVESLDKLKGDRLTKIHNIDKFFRDAYTSLKKQGLFLWGIYPVHNSFFMHNRMSTDLKFIIGVLHGYIARHLSTLEPSVKSESKEDYEMSIRYYLHDGGVVRFNNISPKTKFHAPGGLGTERQEMNKHAAQYLEAKYPDIVTVYNRATNGMTEVELARKPRFYP